MSNQIFPLNLFTSNQRHDEITDLWVEVFEEGGEAMASKGVIQLVLDMLKQSCHDPGTNDFQIPTTIALTAVDLERFVNSQTSDKTFDQNVQAQNDEILCRLIKMFVQNSNDVSWMEKVRSFFCVLSKVQKTDLLVAKTLVHFYTEVVIARSEPNINAATRKQLKQTSERLLKDILDVQTDAIDVVLEAFFERINSNPELIQRENDGCCQIIASFLSIEELETNIDALIKIIRLGENQAHGGHFLRLCAGEAILRELCLIITCEKSVRVQRLALEVACHIQGEVRERRLFENDVFTDCVRSDDENLRQLVARLLKLTFRGPNNDVAQPAEVLRRTVQLHLQFRRDFVKCPKRLVDTFFDEFTNWSAVFDVVQMRLAEQSFIDELFHLLKFVIKRIKNNGNAEQSLRSYSHTAIQFLDTLDRQYVMTHDNIINTIMDASCMLKWTNNEHCEIFARTIREVCGTDFFDTHSAQMNGALALKHLVRKGIIEDAIRRQLVQKCIAERNQQQEDLRKSMDFDKNPAVLQTAMKISVFTGLRLMDEDAALVCNQSYPLVVHGPLDLRQNRMFLAYNLLSLVDTCIVEFAKVAVPGSHPITVIGISPIKITLRLLEILKGTSDDIDFLCGAVFWGLCKMEICLRTLSNDHGLDVLINYVLKMISLVKINRQSGANRKQLEHLQYMLVQIQLLIQFKRPVNVRKLVVELVKKFPDHDLAFGLMKVCAEFGSFDVLNECILDTLKELRTKKSKEAFVKTISPIVASSPRLNILQDQVKSLGLKIEV